MLSDEAARARLAEHPHPKGWAGKTLLSWLDWMLEHAGASGRQDALRAARAVLS